MVDRETAMTLTPLEESFRKRNAVKHLVFPTPIDKAGGRRVLLGAEWNLAPADSAITHVLDVGAHVGTFTCYAADFWPNAMVLAVEPDPDNYHCLETNTAHLPTVHLLQAALGNGLPVSYLGQRSRRSSSIRYGYSRGKEGLVPSHTLAQLVTLVGFSGKPGEALLVKIDAEGAEWGCLKDPASVDALKSTQAFVIDIHGFKRKRFVRWAQTWITTHVVSVCYPGRWGTNIHGFRTEESHE
jgi:FkbM family methyltransferase